MLMLTMRRVTFHVEKGHGQKRLQASMMPRLKALCCNASKFKSVNKV
jgi:hypothetical protein